MASDGNGETDRHKWLWWIDTWWYNDRHVFLRKYRHRTYKQMESHHYTQGTTVETTPFIFDIGQRERHFEWNDIVYILKSDRERLHFEWNDIAYILISDRERLYTSNETTLFIFWYPTDCTSNETTSLTFWYQTERDYTLRMKQHCLYFGIRQKETLRMKRHRLYFDIGQRETLRMKRHRLYQIVRQRETTVYVYRS